MQQYLDCGATAVEWKREESPGAVGLFGSTVFVHEVGSSRNASTRDGQRQVGHHGHPPISRTHYRETRVSACQCIYARVLLLLQ